MGAFQGTSVFDIALDNNEAAFSIAVVPFTGLNNEYLLAVGTASDTFVAPRSCSHGYIRLYRFAEDGRTIELLHKASDLSSVYVSSRLTQVPPLDCC